MNWITIIWSTVASACLMLAVLHLLVWSRNRAARASLFLSIAAAATAALAMIELWAMKADVPSAVGTANRWGQVPVLIVLVSLVVLVRIQLRAGRPWLAWTVCTLRTACLLPNVFSGQSFNYRQVTGLRHVTLFGEFISVPEGVANPWMLIGQASLLLCIVYVIDAVITARRRGEWRQALVIGGSIVFFVLAGGVQSFLSFWQIVPMPATPSLFFVGMVAVMAYELSRDAGRAPQLADDLRESDARMALAAEATGVGVWQWSIPPNRIWGSERWRNLFSFAEDEIVTLEKVIRRIHPDDREMVERGVHRAREDGADYAGDFRVLSAGSECWVAAHGRVYRDARGNPDRMLGTAIDITARRRAEIILAESEQRYRTLFETAPVGILLIGPDGNVRAANPAQARLYGYESPEQFVGVYAPLCVAERDRERARQTMRDLLSGEERASRRYVAVRRDGSEFIVEVTSAILRGLDLEVRGYLCLTRDITESERIQAALRDSERRFREVAEISEEFIWEVDAAGLYTYASPSVEKILGYTAAELIGKKHFYDLFVPSVREELKAVAFQVFAERRAFRDLLTSNISKSGKVVHLETSGAPMVDTDGNLLGYRGADTNVTDRRQLQLQLQRLRDELAHMARVSAMGQLASSLAHELNQPLGAILRNAEAAELYLRDPSPDLDELRAILADIRKDDQRAGDVIDRMRAMLKRRELESRLLDLGVLVKTVGLLVRPDAERRRIRLAMEDGSVLPAVQGDQVQLQQVLINLMLNAMDAMEETPPHDRVITIELRATGTEVGVAVSDNGPGIPADRLPLIFEPFFTSKPKGLGMGLPIARDIIEAHGGRLWAENKAAGGATFTFALPVAKGGGVV